METSLGGWAYTRELFPVSGWRLMESPIEWIEQLPEQARRAGEAVNMWLHHLLILPGENAYLYYDSGPYGQERLFCRHTTI